MEDGKEKMIGLWFEKGVRGNMDIDREKMFIKMKKKGYRGKSLSWASFFYAIWLEWRA